MREGEGEERQRWAAWKRNKGRVIEMVETRQSRLAPTSIRNIRVPDQAELLELDRAAVHLAAIRASTRSGPGTVLL